MNAPISCAWMANVRAEAGRAKSVQYETKAQTRPCLQHTHPHLTLSVSSLKTRGPAHHAANTPQWTRFLGPTPTPATCNPDTKDGTHRPATASAGLNCDGSAPTGRTHRTTQSR